MKCVCLFVLFSIAFAGICGTYQSVCQNDPMGISSSQNTLKIHCGFNGFVNRMTWTDVDYSQKQCVGVKVLTSVYKMSAIPESKESKSDTTYSVTTKKVTVKSENATDVTKGYTCTTEMKNGKTYDLNKFSCIHTTMEVDRFIVQRAFLRRPFRSQFVFSEKVLNVESGLLMGEYTKVSSWGCMGWTIFFVVLGVVVVVAIVAAILVYLHRAPTVLKTKLTK